MLYLLRFRSNTNSESAETARITNHDAKRPFRARHRRVCAAAFCATLVFIILIYGRIFLRLPDGEVGADANKEKPARLFFQKETGRRDALRPAF